MDKKFGPTWHCCIGEGFGYDITYNTRNMIMIYYGEVSRKEKYPMEKKELKERYPEEFFRQ